MKTWYCVTTSYYDDGRVAAAVTDKRQSKDKPEKTSTWARKCDVYCEWYETIKEAEDAVFEARCA